MIALLELRDKLKNFYGEHESIFRPIFKFLTVFISMLLIKFNIGYFDLINMWLVVLAVAMLFAFLPWNAIVIGLGVVITANICSFSIALGLIVLIVVLITLLFFFRFTPKEGLFLVLIPLAFFLKIPYAIPLVVGLVCTPVSIVSVSCGTILYFIISIIAKNDGAFTTIGVEEGRTGLNTIFTLISNNKEMLLTVIAFAATITVVYLIRKSSIDNAWNAAIIVGGIVDFVVLLIGNLILKTGSSIVWLIVGTILSMIVVFIFQFFVFSVDYSRVEHTQFEDDEYYYYVKAVPKINVAAPEMNVKRINAQRKRKTISRKSGNKK